MVVRMDLVPNKIILLFLFIASLCASVAPTYCYVPRQSNQCLLKRHEYCECKFSHDEESATIPQPNMYISYTTMFSDNPASCRILREEPAAIPFYRADNNYVYKIYSPNLYSGQVNTYHKNEMSYESNRMVYYNIQCLEGQSLIFQTQCMDLEDDKCLDGGSGIEKCLDYLQISVDNTVTERCGSDTDHINFRIIPTGSLIVVFRSINGTKRCSGFRATATCSGSTSRGEMGRKIQSGTSRQLAIELEFISKYLEAAQKLLLGTLAGQQNFAMEELTMNENPVSRGWQDSSAFHKTDLLSDEVLILAMQNKAASNPILRVVASALVNKLKRENLKRSMRLGTLLRQSHEPQNRYLANEYQGPLGNTQGKCYLGESSQVSVRNTFRGHLELLKDRYGLLGRNGALGIAVLHGEHESRGRNGHPALLRGETTYTRWGKRSCSTLTSIELVYTGIAGGSFYNQGHGSNYICLPEYPEYSSNLAYRSGIKSYGVTIHGLKYKYPSQGGHNRNVRCAVCRVSTRPTVVTIPAMTTCPPTWTTVYSGYLIAENKNHHRTRFECVDAIMETFLGSYGDKNDALFYHMEASCTTGLPCPPYSTGQKINCVVCTK